MIGRALKAVGLFVVAAYGLAVAASSIWAVFWGTGEASLAMIVPLIVALPFVFVFSSMFHSTFGPDAIVIGILLQLAFFGYCALWIFRYIRWRTSADQGGVEGGVDLGNH